MRLKVLFFIVLLLEIYGSISYNRQLVFITKPLLMPILMGLAYLDGYRGFKLYSALFFSLLGDFFLMFFGENYFTLGLGSFLIAQIFYILLFYPESKFSFMPIVAFGLFVAGFLIFLYPHIDGSMKIPVIIYAVTIAIMGIMAALRVAHPGSYLLVLIGAILFIISDSLIAFNKFYLPIPREALYIMSTYGIGQFLIVTGYLKDQKDFP